MPEASVRVPASVCGPSERVPVAKSTCVPVIVGATVARPSSVMLLSVTISLASSTIELAEATTEPSAGVAAVMLGAVLSIRMLVRTEVPTLPSASTAVARMS